MLGLGTLVKMSKGGNELDLLCGLAQAAGVELKLSPLATGQSVREELHVLVSATGKAGAQVMCLEGRMKDGSMLRALLVLHV